MTSLAPLPLAPSRRRGDEHRVFRRYRRDRDPAIRNALVERFMPLARHLARRYPSGGEREDVLQVASLALVKAVERFDPDRGVAFTSFATPTIIGEIKRYFRDCGWAVRMPRELQDLALRAERVTEQLTGRLGRSPTPGELAGALGVSVERVLEALATVSAHYPVALERLSRDEDDATPMPVGVDEPGFARVDDAVAVDALLDLLPERERIVTILRFREDLFQREIAELVGVSQMQISRILATAIARLRELSDESAAACRAPGCSRAVGSR
jgi:RNA polymerase sigma-B factor